MTANSKHFEFNPGSTKPLIHLAHANGFLPQTYQEALKPLLPDYRILSFYPRPFWGDTPPEWLKSWSQMADDLIVGVEGLTAQGTPHPNPLPQGARGILFEGSHSPSMGEGRGEGAVKSQGVIGIGHSLGGVLTLNAAVKRPDLFSKVILIDPTMLPPKLLFQIRFLKMFGLDARKRLIKGALRRKRSWENAREAFEYFRGRQLFRNWSDAMVRAYSDSITGPSPEGGVGLLYPPEWEARIYKTIPTDVWRTAKALKIPTLVIRGETSNTFTEDSEKAFRKANPTVTFRVVPGAGHLVPQEKPEEIGRLIMGFL